jgi:hypothetical protein|nr:MAG TPA: hypothetical protein [Caudoviricetes sp.]
MPQINILPSAVCEAEDGYADMSDRAVQKSAECSEMAKAAETLAMLRQNSADVCRRKDEEKLSVETIMKAFDKAARKAVEEMKTDKASAFVQEVCDDVREAVFRGAVGREVGLTFESRAALLERAVSLNAEFLKEVPAEYDAVCADFAESVEHSGLPVFMKNALKLKASREFATAVLDNVGEADSEKLAGVWEDGKIRELFSEEEAAFLKNKAEDAQTARQAEKVFERLEAEMLLNISPEEGCGRIEAWIKENPEGLSKDVLDIVASLNGFYFRREQGEVQVRVQKELLDDLKKMKELCEEGREDEAFLHLNTCGLKYGAPELFDGISEAFTEGKIGAGEGKSGFISLVSGFCRTGVLPEAELYEAFLLGALGSRDFALLSEMAENLSEHPSVFYVRKAMGALIASQQSEEAVYAGLTALYYDFAAAAAQGASVCELRKIIRECLDLG